jgi:hypothetical protein
LLNRTSQLFISRKSIPRIPSIGIFAIRTLWTQ